MGIKGLKSYIGKKWPEVFQEVSYDLYAGKKIAVDIIGLIFCYKACSEQWKYSLKRYLNNFDDIKLLIVFEGKSPVEKSSEQQQRRLKRSNLKNELDQLQHDINQYEYGVIAEPTGLMKNYIEKLAKPTRSTAAAISKVVESIDVPEEEITPLSMASIVCVLKCHVDKVKRQTTSITHDDIMAVKQICSELSLEYIEAAGEAEKTCANLCLNGIVDAVISEDSDLIALQCPLILFRTKTPNYFKQFSFEKFKQCSGLSIEQIVDWAILCGTDYNVTLPKIGIIRALEIVEQYKSIDNFILYDNEIKTKYNITNEAIKALDHLNVRSLFNAHMI